MFFDAYHFFLGSCQGNQKCIPLKECPYTFNLLKKIVKTKNRVEKLNLVEEMSSFVCDTADRSVCCDFEEITEKDKALLRTEVFSKTKETNRRTESNNHAGLNLLSILFKNP